MPVTLSALSGKQILYYMLKNQETPKDWKKEEVYKIKQLLNTLVTKEEVYKIKQLLSTLVTKLR